MDKGENGGTILWSGPAHVVADDSVTIQRHLKITFCKSCKDIEHEVILEGAMLSLLTIVYALL